MVELPPTRAYEVIRPLVLGFAGNPICLLNSASWEIDQVHSGCGGIRYANPAGTGVGLNAPAPPDFP